MLLSGNVFCSACGLELTVNQEESKESMDKLHEHWQAVQDCKRKPSEALPGGSVSTTVKGK
jgi:uncharacterized Zn finger protein (UPF0148 family)